MRWASAIILGIVLLSVAASAQPGPVGAMQTTAEATVEVQPDYYEFWFHYHVEAAAFAEAVQQALALESNIRESLKSRELAPMEIEVSDIALQSMEHPAAERSARIRMPAGPYREGDKGLKELAKLSDAFRELARDWGCQAEGPVPGVLEPEIHEKRAVAEALAKSLPLAENGAAVMSATVLVVESAAVSDIVWNRQNGWRSTIPDVHRMTCTATVNVTYAFGAKY